LPHELTSEEIYQYRVYLAKTYNKNTQEPLKRSSLNYYLIALRNLLNYFAERDILALPAEKSNYFQKRRKKVLNF